MSNPGHFKNGYDARRKLDGREKGTGKDIRIQLNYEMLQTHAPIFEEVLMFIAIEARDGKDLGLKKWYVKEFKEYFYGKPKTEIEIGGATNLEEAIEHIKGTLPKSVNEEIFNIIKTHTEKVSKDG